MARPWELMMGWDWVKPKGQKSERTMVLVSASALGWESDAMSAALTAAVSEASTEHTSVTPMERPLELMMGWDWVKPMGQKSERTMAVMSVFASPVV
jgi:hypothetical protein